MSEKAYNTKWPELQFAHISGTNIYWDKETRKDRKRHVSFWQFINDGHQVGPQYPTKEALLADMDRYAKESWGLN